MILKIQKWGNSHGIRIPKAVLEELKWRDNEKINLKIEKNKIIIEKNEKRKNIKELFENYKGKYAPIDIDWGENVGDEIW